jgi:phenylalanine-4-hydroxylase
MRKSILSVIRRKHSVSQQTRNTATVTTAIQQQHHHHQNIHMPPTMSVQQQVERSEYRKIRVPHQQGIDDNYKQRKNDILEIAKQYSIGQPIPSVQYTNHEIQVWNTVYKAMVNEYYPKYAIYEVLETLPLMEQCGFGLNKVPQLENVSQCLKNISGFELRPVEGLLDARQFLAAMAQRVFYCTQYVRHHGNPQFSPDPDCIHDLLGHIPLLLNPVIADMSQMIGEASIRATEEQVAQLRFIYWNTIETGVVKQDGKRRAYGAALLSSFGELEHLQNIESRKMRKFDIEAVITQGPIDDSRYQEFYFFSDTLEEVKKQVEDYCNSI